MLEHLRLGRGVLLPERGPERFAFLINGERVVGVVHGPAQPHVVELTLLVEKAERAGKGNAERAHGVPHADEFHAGLVGEALAEQLGLRRIRVRRVIPPTVEVVRRGELIGILPFQQPAVANEAHDTARGVRAAAEAEEEKFVAGLVVGHQEAVTVLDVFREPNAEGSTEQMVEPAGAHALVVEHALLDSRRVL